MKTFPCIKGKMGDWAYYLTSMRVTELVNYVKFADQLFPRDDLDQIMQRELTKRSEGITEYLLKNDQRFMGALIVAAVGGEPKFIPVSFGDESAYSFAEGKLGFLRFDGSESYYTLDGQHRLAAIRDGLARDPERLSKDEVSLIIVWHKNDEDGRKRARRLFTTVNRYARKTSREEDLAFDEDNPVDIFTRRLVREHAFLKQRTKVTNLARQGEFRLTKTESMRPEDGYDRNFLFALLTLKRCNQILMTKWLSSAHIEAQKLPDFEVLEQGYAALVQRWNQLIERVPPWQHLNAEPGESLDKYRKKNGGHPLVRPIAIVAFVGAVATVFDEGGEMATIQRVANQFADLTVHPLRGLLWKEEKGGMHDGQARRNAAQALFSYYLMGQPTKENVVLQWEGATGRALPSPLLDREA